MSSSLFSSRNAVSAFLYAFLLSPSLGLGIPNPVRIFETRVADHSAHSNSGEIQNSLMSVNKRITDNSPGATCNDLKGTSLSQVMWDQTQTTRQLTEWVSSHPESKSNFTSAFAQPLGLEQSLGSCYLGNPGTCGRPDCLNMENPGKANSGWGYEVVVSMSNVKIWLNSLYNAVNLASKDYQGMQVTVQQTYYPNNDGANLVLKEILAAVGTATILTGVWAGGPAAGIAVNVIAGVIGNGIMAIPNGDKTFKHISENEIVGKTFTEGITKLLGQAFEEFSIRGPYSTNLHPGFMEMLDHGAWLDAREIPILNQNQGNTKVTPTSLRDYYTSMILSSVINSAWKAQNVYIMCFPMTQQEFDSNKVKAGNNDSRLKMYYQNMGCYLQSVMPRPQGPLTVPTTIDPPGWGQMNSGFTTWDAIKGSVDAYLTGGYAYNNVFNNPIDNSRPHPELTAGPTYAHPGLWNLPVCRLPEDQEKKTKLKDMLAMLNGPNGKDDFSFCYCRERLDKNGAKIGTVLKLDSAKLCKKTAPSTGCRRGVISESVGEGGSVLEERCRP